MRSKLSLLSIAVIIMALLIGQAVLASQAEQSTQDTIELVGPVQTINADGSIVVNGVTVTITTAEINVALTAGQMVKVEGTLLADGRIAAREVRAPGDDDDIRDDDEIELIGTVESYDGMTLVVNGIVIDLSGAEINDPIVVGQIIKIHASFDDNGNLIARETDDNLDDNDDDDSGPSPESTPEVGDDDDDDDDDRPGEFEITGTLQDVGDGFIVVNGQTISITGAEIKNQLVVGALVKLHLSNQNGQLVAREVENADDDDDDDDTSGSSDDDSWDEVYTVRPGDTLSSIAARAGVSVEELARINNITDTSVVIAGSRLIVPDDFDDDDGGSSGSSSDDDDNFDDNDDNDDNSGSGSGDDDDNFDDNDDDSSDDDNDDNSGSSDDDNDDDGGDDDSDDDSGDDDDGGSSGSGGDDDDD